MSKGQSRGSSRLIGVIIGLLLAVAVGGGLSLAQRSAAQAPQPATPAASVPVTVAHAERQDFPVYLTGLGTVQAFNSVLVRARVDGTLMQVPVAEGQEVKKGDVIAVIDPRPYQAVLDQAMAKRQQDEAQLANAKRDLARYTSLAKQDYASHQQVDQQQASVAQLTAAIAGDTATVEAAQLNLSYCYITSPIGGRVGLRQVDPGNLIHANDAGGIVTITQIHPIAVIFTLPQEDLPRIGAAMVQRKLPVATFASDGKTGLGRGELVTLDNAIDQSTGTIKLKAVFPNTQDRLWPGQFVNARLLVDTEKNVLIVPSIAVQHGPSGLYVYVVKPNSTVARRAVATEADDGQVAVIAQGLSDSAVVVTGGQSRLQDGTRVAANTSEQQPTPAPNI